MPRELPKTYDAADTEPRIFQRWMSDRAFAASPDSRDPRYVVMMPLPNVTGALHMGHAMDNVMQDLLIRWHRMRQDNTLWMPGTDHAGIATQAVIEKRLLELEGKTRNDIGREALVERIWQWKDQYQKRIVSQQQAMGCSCDWDRQRFTMDEICARAVRWTFIAMFRDGLIFRGNRLINWDCHLQTAVADDEIEQKDVAGHFWHLRYPVIDPQDGEPTAVVVATTRPETMLGDSGVACHPEPARALDAAIAERRARLESAPQRERADIQASIDALEERRTTHLPLLEKLVAMARAGRKLTLPLEDRPIPLICDEWAKPELGSGCVKLTPAHDPNDYEVWKRHPDVLDLINVLEPDGTMSERTGAYAGLDRFAARDRVVADLDRRGLVEKVEDRVIPIGHSARSKTPIEPYLSKQWFVRMGDVDGGVTLGRGTAFETQSPGLAQAALDATSPDWSSPTGRRVTFHPDERYRGTYVNWLQEKRDWCISRQLWWGHRIPIWSATLTGDALDGAIEALRPHLDRADVCARVAENDGTSVLLTGSSTAPRLTSDEPMLQVCLRDDAVVEELASVLADHGLGQDPDVLDTWFSSGLWPQSTLGWPDPETAVLLPGQSALGASEDNPDCLDYYYPGSCLVTGRDIITLWVARMVLMGLYNRGDVPFSDVFIHANILDGKGEMMSKSRGNGVDPVDIIEQYGADAMRYVICELQTGTQDIRLPVQAISPFNGEHIELSTAKHGRSIFTYLDPNTGGEFDVLGTMPDLPSAKLICDRFDDGRKFCTKLWNAARFALMNLDESHYEARELTELPIEDRWILSRLSAAVAAVDGALDAYNPSAAIGIAREFFWSDLCDWYLELIKPRMRDEAAAPLARQVLAVALDHVLRLLHPFVPFITEELWEHLGAQAPSRGIDVPLAVDGNLVRAPWPQRRAEWSDAENDARVELMQEVTRAVREMRSRYNVSPKERLRAICRTRNPTQLAGLEALIQQMAGLDTLEMASDVERTADAATAVVRDIEIFIPGMIDVDKERARLIKQRDKVSKELDAVRRKLGNQGFLAKAKPELVERERERLATGEAELAGIEASLAALS